MSDEQQRPVPTEAATEGGWQPIPQGPEYDAEGTAFVQLPPELLAHPRANAASAPGGWDPLAAPGTGYPPPRFDQAQYHQPAPPAQGEQWQQPHPAAAPGTSAASVDPGSAGQWTLPYGQGQGGAAYAPQGSSGADGSVGQFGQWGHDGAPAPSGSAAAPDPDGGPADPHATAQWPMPGAHGDDGVPSGGGQWSVPAAGDDPVDESGEYSLGMPLPTTPPYGGHIAPQGTASPGNASGVPGHEDPHATA
ncbi:hypothetical protein ADK38_30285, partial [Streptomyces varsoviensis]